MTLVVFQVETFVNSGGNICQNICVQVETFVKRRWKHLSRQVETFVRENMGYAHAYPQAKQLVWTQFKPRGF
jgi:hypothetical protein